MANMVYNVAKKMLLEGTLDLDTDTIKIFPITSAALTNPDPATVGALTFTEHAGTGYTWGHGGTGRQTVAGRAATQDDTDDEGVLDGTDVTYTALGTNAATTGILLHRAGPTNDTDAIPIAWIDCVFTSNGGNVTIQWNAEGILNLN